MLFLIRISIVNLLLYKIKLPNCYTHFTLTCVTNLNKPYIIQFVQ